MGKIFEFESFPDGFTARIPWHSGAVMEEGVDGEPMVLIDDDLAMVWVKYWFRTDAELTHVGTNCFNLMKGDWDDGKGLSWRICGMTDTARRPSEAERQRLNSDFLESQKKSQN